MESKKILLVEDDKLISDLYQRQLEKAGYVVKPVGNGLEALEMAKNEKFDLVLLDIMLPELDGFRVLERLKAENKTKDLDVVILSNLGQDDLLKKALQKGARAYIIKSLTTPAQVLTEIKSVLG